MNNYIHTEETHNISAASEVLPYLINIFSPKSVIDIGCGTGTWLNVAQKYKIPSIKGLDGAKLSKELKVDSRFFEQVNLESEIKFDTLYDLAICLEVAEHLAVDYSKNLIKTLTNCSKIILFSAAVPGQGGQNHINEQWPNFWQKLFHEQGFHSYDILRSKFWCNDKVDWWYSQNMFIYIHESITGIIDVAPDKNLLPLIHPRCLALKDNKIEYLQKIIDNPTLVGSIKSSIKSILKFKIN